MYGHVKFNWSNCYHSDIQMSQSTKLLFSPCPNHVFAKWWTKSSYPFISVWRPKRLSMKPWPHARLFYASYPPSPIKHCECVCICAVFNAWTFVGPKDCHLPAQLKSFICCNPFLEFSQLFDYRVCGIMFRKSSRVSKPSNRRYWKEEVAHVFCFFSLFLHMHPRRSHILP